MSAGTDPQTGRSPDRAVAFFDLFDPGFQPDGPAVHAAREACWYARTSLGYAVLRYAEAAALLRDRRLRQGGVESLAAQGITEGLLADWMRVSLLNQEGEPHARLRRLVSQAFTPRAVDALRPMIRTIAHELIDGFAARGACEFMAAFADPYPSRIMAALLGIPRERYPQFHGWATDLGLLFGYAVAQYRPRIEAALLGLAACVDDLLAERRAAPGPDLISALIAAEEAGDHLSDVELRHPGDGAGVRRPGHHPQPARLCAGHLPGAPGPVGQARRRPRPRRPGGRGGHAGAAHGAVHLAGRHRGL